MWMVFFRFYIIKEIKWGGVKYDLDERDDGRRMYLLFLFKVFLEVVKRSLLWDDVEMDVIYLF